jgi:hypothetical protein
LPAVPHRIVSNRIASTDCGARPLMIAKCSRRSTPFTVATLLDGSQHAERNSVEPTLQIRLRRAHPIADALQQPDSRGPTELERAITDAGPFGSIGEAQAAVDGWREEYNHRRPRADGERTRRAILRTAASLATVDGLEGLSIGNLAAGDRHEQGRPVRALGL